MAASAHLLLSALSKPSAEPSAEPHVHVYDLSDETSRDDTPYGESRYCVFTAEGPCGEVPLTSEPPLPDAEPLTSEPPLADAAPLTSEPTSTGVASGS
ncbi:hypothetical protein ACFV6E_12545 [Streptomyces sp. NPDC059785]|uniref:hypothetical protein n=1 Tax=unclassified Streptomyces TaxID=2593676 RepID=UPI00366428C3